MGIARTRFHDRRTDLVYPAAASHMTSGKRGGSVASYIIRANGDIAAAGLMEPVTLTVALGRAVEFKAKGYDEITLVNVDDGVEITDVEQFMRAQVHDA